MEMVIESGRYETFDGVLRLDEPAAGETHAAQRLNGRIYLDWNRHVLVLAPGDGSAAAEGGDS
jgi:hypothetical protein